MFVASYAHISTNPVQASWKYVDIHKEAVDLYIMNHVSKGDIVKARKQGVYGKGLKAFTNEDRNRFVQNLTKILSKFEGISN